jgi:hypothetical protein
MHVAVYYHRQFLPDVPVLNLRGDVFKWINGTYTNLSVNEFDSYVEFFDYLAKSKKSSRLPKLALINLGFIMNNAGPKRLFSKLAMIHTATRNCLNPEKAR